MTDQKNSFYIGFRHGSDGGNALGLGVFRTRDAVDELFEKSEPDGTAKGENSDFVGEAETFENIATEFFEQFIAMLDLLPMGAGSTMLIRQILIQDLLANHVTPHATDIEKNDGREVYRVPLPLFSEFNRRLSRTSRIADSVSILPSIALLGLVGQFDGFMGRILKRIYQLEPRKIIGKDRTVLIGDVLSATSLADFQTEIIDREVEKILRGSHADQIEHLERALGTEVRKHISDWDAFIEVFERRNLFAHTGGRVSKVYIERVGLSGDLNAGSYLTVTPKYLQDAASLLLEVGLKIIHIAGRTRLIEKAGDFPGIEDAFIDHSYELLVHGHYKAAQSMLDFSLDKGMKISDPKTKIVLSVNRAICHRESGNIVEAQAILNPYRDMPLEPRFRIPILAVLGEVGAVCTALETASSSDIRPDEIFGWPAFKWMHSDEKFRAVVSYKYPNEYAALKLLLFATEGNEDN